MRAHIHSVQALPGTGDRGDRANRGACDGDRGRGIQAGAVGLSHRRGQSAFCCAEVLSRSEHAFAACTPILRRVCAEVFTAQMKKYPAAGAAGYFAYESGTIPRLFYFLLSRRDAR